MWLVGPWVTSFIYTVWHGGKCVSMACLFWRAALWVTRFSTGLSFPLLTLCYLNFIFKSPRRKLALATMTDIKLG